MDKSIDHVIHGDCLWTQDMQDAHDIFMAESGEVEEEERRWNETFSKPHVQAALERMADEARQQHEAGETKEGGFAVRLQI